MSRYGIHLFDVGPYCHVFDFRPTRPKHILNYTFLVFFLQALAEYTSITKGRKCNEKSDHAEFLVSFFFSLPSADGCYCHRDCAYRPIWTECAHTSRASGVDNQGKSVGMIDARSSCCGLLIHSVESRLLFLLWLSESLSFRSLELFFSLITFPLLPTLRMADPSMSAQAVREPERTAPPLLFFVPRFFVCAVSIFFFHSTPQSDGQASLPSVSNARAGLCSFYWPALV